MKVIVVFDILEEYREVRDELRKFLKDMGGVFLQYSVYEADLDPEGVRRLLRGIKRILRCICICSDTNLFEFLFTKSLLFQ